MLPRTALAVPTPDPRKLEGEWLAALERQSLKPDRVLLLDDSPSKNPSPAGRRLRDERGWLQIELGAGEFDHARTRQKALERLEGAEIVIFMTDDAVLAEESALERLVSAFEDPKVGAAFGRQLPRPGAGPLEAHHRLFNYPGESRVVSLEDAPRYGIKTAFMSDSFGAYRREALLEVGGFPRKNIVAEDMFAAAKLLLAGWSVVYRADAKVFHSHAYGPAEEFGRYFDTGAFHAANPWIRERFGGAGGEGRRFVLSELGYLRKEGMAGMIPGALARTALKALGYKLGLLSPRLPKAVNRMMARHPGFFEG